jgi:hypothetical protein
MSKQTIIKRIEKIEQNTGEPQIVVAIKEPAMYEGVKVNGALMSDAEFERFKQALPKETQLYIVGVSENKPPQGGAKNQ